MRAISFLHQKGGTGKSTLAIACALALAAEGARPLLVDADPQGTTAEWGNRFAKAFGLEIVVHVQPDLHDQAPVLGKGYDWMLIDGPPALSAVTEGILRASAKVIIPVRPSLPDLWALPWLAAIIRKLRGSGAGPEPRVVFNLHRGEPLDALKEQISELGLPVHDPPVPAHAAFAELFAGKRPPENLLRPLLEMLQE